MEMLSWGMIVLLELVVVLTLALALMTALWRRQRQQLKMLQTATPSAPAMPVIAARGRPEPAQTALTHIETQISATRARHLLLTPDRDIVLDIAHETPLERQTLALRHAFLVAEREAVLAGRNGEVAWDVLVAKLGQIIQYYRQPEPSPLAAVADESAFEPFGPV
ncbi:MAG: hypothetical protein RBS88_01810 [Spongiibacteraceae bacterium]|nr:hypothetical protein [Spongiibacteraceae bacterium]